MTQLSEFVEKVNHRLPIQNLSVKEKDDAIKMRQESIDTRLKELIDRVSVRVGDQFTLHRIGDCFLNLEGLNPSWCL